MNNYVIETRNLTKQYETQKSVADLNIHVKKGRIYGLLGLLLSEGLLGLFGLTGSVLSS